MGAVAVVLKGYPRLSETFIAQEIRALEQRGLNLRLYSLRHPTDRTVHPVHREIQAPVVYLPEYLRDDPRRVAAAWRRVRLWPGYNDALRMWRRDLVRDRTTNRIRRFGQALVLASEIADDTDWIHAHFLHTPASVARYAAKIRSLPWSVSAHAKDIWTISDWEKEEKLADCRWLVTCTRTNAEHLDSLAPGPDIVDLVYHGLDLSRFPPAPTRPALDGQDLARPITILSVGRTVEKKGFDVLLTALAKLPKTLHWRFIHIGSGPLDNNLRSLANSLGVDDQTTWCGPLPQDRVIDHYRSADLFVLPCRIAADGDRDGLPNVLMEAMSQGLPCISTYVSAVSELITDGNDGTLVPPEDPGALVKAIEQLIGNPDLRRRLGHSAVDTVRSRFTMEAGIERLASKLGAPVQSAEEAQRACVSSSTLL